MKTGLFLVTVFFLIKTLFVGVAADNGPLQSLVQKLNTEPWLTAQASLSGLKCLSKTLVFKSKTLWIYFVTT
ncbi:hypothetical protein, partial [Klebsiella pneumoniae]|uniref:hypothetical protein n=1 Tax=Klebsiella pneumoniae TaxID=573 RepID=UPI0035328011